MYTLYRIRKLLGWLPALIALAVVMSRVQSTPLKIEPSFDLATVEVALYEPEPESRPEPLPLPEPAEPEPEPEPIVEQQPLPVAEEPNAVAEPPPPPKPSARAVPKQQPRPAPKPQPAPAAATAAANKPVPAPPAPPRVDHQAIEERYLHSLRNDLDRYKQYPTGRQASLERPSGEVVIWLLVDRTGKVLDSGIQNSATSMLLNRAATNSLRRVQQVAPFPGEAFAGQTQLRITATFNYSAP